MFKSRLTRIAAIVIIILIGAGIWWYQSPKVLFQSSGNNVKVKAAKTFTTHGKWTVTYNYKCSTSAGSKGVNFAYFVIEPNDLQSDTVALTKASAKATVTYRTKGQHHLAILSYCPYSIVVKG